MINKNDLLVSEQINMVFSGTSVLYGNCTCVVVKTGENT